MKKLSILAILILLQPSCSKDSSTGPEENFETAADFTLTDVDNNKVSLSDFTNQVLVLNFFATWCGPCQDEMPQLDTNIWQAYKD